MDEDAIGNPSYGKAKILRFYLFFHEIFLNIIFNAII